jgi:hypothetical protein
VVRYYNFDVMSVAPAPIWVLFREGASTPLPGQLNIIDVVPGEGGNNDFWQVMKVTVPAGYVANTATSIQDILDAGYPVEVTDMVVNCPVVPEGSTALEGPGANGLTLGWYKDQVVFYFDFDEAPLAATANGEVPTSPIFVSFNVDPDQAGGGPASGFMTQGSSVQTHNVVATVPGDVDYSPLWGVHPFSNQDFEAVYDLPTAMAVDNFGLVADVNCPVVFVGEAPGNPASATKTVIDRFSDDAGNLFRRSGNADLPAPGEAIDFDTGPFITQGFGPDGGVVRYYNFDVMSTAAAPIFGPLRRDGRCGAAPHALGLLGCGLRRSPGQDRRRAGRLGGGAAAGCAVHSPQLLHPRRQCGHRFTGRGIPGLTDSVGIRIHHPHHGTPLFAAAE